MTSLTQAKRGTRGQHDRGLVVFTALAMNQTRFFEALGNKMREKGYEVAYISFHERSHEYLSTRGARSYNAFDPKPEYLEKIDLDRYSWTSLNQILSHEKAAFEIYDSDRLIRKLRGYLAAVEQVFDELQGEPGRVILIQELGGFLSIIAAFYAARARGIDNLFLEPSFFRGRVFIVRNSFAALPVEGPISEQVSHEVEAYLDEVQAKRNIVIPTKDRHHYRGAWKKLADGRNWKRLARKLADKYLHNKQEEFGHVGGHVWRHTRMFANSQRLKMHYRPLPDGERFIYYPLHVPADVALTLRSPECFDQYALIDYIARCAPTDHKAVIKEHPALVGAVEYSRMRDLLRRHDNLILLDPSINNYDILSRAAVVVTVNSKSGAEALLMGRPVVVLGDAFYASCRLVHRLENWNKLPSLLGTLVTEWPTPLPDLIKRYFQDVWDWSAAGELYETSAENIANFSDSLIRVMGIGE